MGLVKHALVHEKRAQSPLVLLGEESKYQNVDRIGRVLKRGFFGY